VPTKKLGGKSFHMQVMDDWIKYWVLRVMEVIP
jgi:hypothetical protein